MKKVLIGLIIALPLVALLVWLFTPPNSSGPGGNPIVDLLPFGSGDNAPDLTFEEGPSPEEVEEIVFDESGRPAEDLFRLTETPVAGAVAFTKSTSTTMVRYAERATGHIYEVNPATLKKVRLTNQTLPKIYEAHFRSDGQAVLLRSLREDSDAVENLSLTLTPPTGTSTDALYKVSATTLRGDIDSVSTGAGNTLFYSLNDSGAIVSSAFNNTALRTLLTSPFKGWRLAGNGSALVAYPKASFQAPGFAYSINTSNGAMTKLLGPLPGLAVIPDSTGTRLLYSYARSGQVVTEAKNLQTKAVITILPGTLAEKCAWSIRDKGLLYCGSPINNPGAQDIDNWYQGRVVFSDRLWRFDANSEIAQVLFEPKTVFDLDIDVYEPKLSPLEDYLVFINKRDLSLWALKIERP
jgi:hypothetical protein